MASSSEIESSGPASDNVGINVFCSDPGGVPICCDEEGECWEHGTPDDAGVAADGSSWRKAAATTSPPARGNHALAFDSKRGRVVLFGGGEGVSDYLDDTWEYDGTTWTEVAVLAAPSGRRGHTLAYNAARQRVVMFGGWNGETLGDTWEYDGKTWIEMATAESPPSRDGHALAYDAARSRVVLFGGYGATDLKNDTWEYDGTNWIEVSVAQAPKARHLPAMVYDAAQERMVLFGGRGDARTPGCRVEGGNTTFSDTWEYDGAQWVAVATSIAPPARVYHGMAYDTLRQRAVLFGGFDAVCEGVFLGDTWEYSAGTWAPSGPSTRPPRRFFHALTFDETTERVLLFGGYDDQLLDDTWEYTGP